MQPSPMSNQFQIHSMQRAFKDGATREISGRRQRLKKLFSTLTTYEKALCDALYLDLRKSPLDAFVSEIGYVQSEIRHALKHLQQWTQPQRVAVPAGVWPAKAKISPEPKGVVLIIGPWNYPVQLILSPLVAALAAGNCAVLKPSELTPHTAAVLKNLIKKTFDSSVVQLVEGDRKTAETLLTQPFDHIFFTGGTEIGRRVALAAARQLIPSTLELGGKNPAILCADANLSVAARRIVRGRFMNAGQLCVAPDHLWVPRNRLSAITAELQKTITQFFGTDPRQSADYGRIVNSHHFDRLIAMAPGSQSDRNDLYIAPTLQIDPPRDSAALQQEIFGPILPILPYDNEREIIIFYADRPTPLALYLFTCDRAQQQRLMRAIPSGGVCLNDTISQLIPKSLPFGGRGASGWGAYHGKAGFDTFSHARSILTRSLRFDSQTAYPPYKVSLQSIKRLYRFFAGD